MFLYKLPSAYEACVVKRPSKTSKTPYVADIILKNDDTNTEYMAHTASLGCCGLVEKGESIIMKDAPNPKSVCKYRVMMAKTVERGIVNIIGIDPKIAEDMVEMALNKNYFRTLSNIRSYKREYTIMNSRFDYFGTDANKIPFIMEVKNVPLADYVDCYANEKKGMDFSDRDINSKIAYFPDGYRKKQKDTVSPRALKHITELTQIAKEANGRVRTIMCYVIQRRDVSSFQASNVDPIYKAAFTEAVKNGVEIITMQVGWDADGTANFIRDDLPINHN
jgi:DNA-binding sugar fermentation-stimulating protein